MATLPIRSVVSESLLLLLMCYDLLQHKESEQHVWREGIEKYPLIPFVSELKKCLQIQISILESLRQKNSKAGVTIQTP